MNYLTSMTFSNRDRINYYVLGTSSNNELMNEQTMKYNEDAK